MTKTNKIIYAILVAIIVGLVAYALIVQPKVNAGQELINAQARIQELEDLIEDAQLTYAVAESSKQECIESWNKQKEKAHDDAEKYRLEKKELEGFILGR